MHFYHKSQTCVAYHQIIRCVFILFSVSLIFMPERVMGIEEDIYAFNMIKLGVELTYESLHYGTSDRPHKTSIFEQRKSRIPLTLTANRSTSETTSGGKTTTDNFSVDWYLKFRTLPWTRLTYDKTQTQGTGRNEERESSGVEMTKAIGPTDNKISYSVDTTTNNIQNYSSEKTLYTFKNDTTLPLNSDFYLGMVNYNLLTSNGDVKDETDTTAGSMGLSTIRTAKFNQNYNYTFTKTEHSDDNRSTNADYFNGRIGYRTTKRLSTSLNMQSKFSETSSATSSETESKTMNLSMGSSYVITSELSTTETINYKQEKSTSGDPLTGKKERTTIDTSAALNYAKKLSWSAFSAGTSLGWYKETVEPGAGGEGVSYGFNTGLSGIDMTYFILSTSYGYSGVDSYVENVDRKEQTFRSDANSSYINYLPFTVSYVYHVLDSYLDSEDGVENTIAATARMIYLKWLPITASYSHYTLARSGNPPSDLQFAYVEDKKEDNFSLNANLLYFRNTTVSANAAYNQYEQSVVDVGSIVREEDYSRKSWGVNGGHTASLYRGSLNIATGYDESITENTAANTKEDRVNQYIRGKYDKRISRNIAWRLQTEWSDVETNGLHEGTKSVETFVFYRLRQWLLSAEYLYAIKKQEKEKRKKKKKNLIPIFCPSVSFFLIEIWILLGGGGCMRTGFLELGFKLRFMLIFCLITLAAVSVASFLFYFF